MNILSIGGSDPSSGAGIQSDIRVFSSLDIYCFTVITGLTSQNTRKFGSVEAASVNAVKNQLSSILSDFTINAIKIGMVYNSEIIKVVYDSLKSKKMPIIVDPVIRSTTGGVLLESGAIKNYKNFIIPLCHTITPNVYEAEVISGIKLKSKNDLIKIAKKIVELGARNVIITGYKTKNTISDFIFDGKKGLMISGKKINKENHGSGCNYSAALCYAIAKKRSIFDAGKFAKEFTTNSIKNSKKIGRGISITNHQKDVQERELSSAIDQFVKLRDIYTQIPECQTNFVFAKTKPRSIKDILGVAGRIVKVENSVMVAGELKYGSSRHVATAVLQVAKKFPEIRSGLNLRYSEKTLKLLKKKGFHILSYDRNEEPAKIKKKENSSISWGINDVLKRSNTVPDVIFHKGDYGKEPMIIIFGRNPSDIIDKLSSIIRA